MWSYTNGESATASRCVKSRCASISRRSRRCWRAQSGTAICSIVPPIGCGASGLEPLLEEGVRYFGVGGALGFNTLVAEKPLMLRENRPEIRIILVQPFPGYQNRWTPALQPRAAIESKVDKVVICRQRPVMRSFWPEVVTWWTAPPAVSLAIPAPLAAPHTPCAMCKGRPCRSGT